MTNQLTLKWDEKKKRHEHHADQRFGAVSYAQHGDDLFLLNMLETILPHMEPERLSGQYFLDIGAHHPVNISNTYLLYQRGLHGVNVDANEKAIKLFEETRLNDRNVCSGVVPLACIPDSGLLPFYMYSEMSGRNTLSADEVKAYGATVKETKEVPVTTINSIVDQHCGGVWPLILSVDIEGLDFSVLESASFYPGNRPAIVVVETRVGEPTIRMVRMMLSKGYITYCRTGENLIFVEGTLPHVLINGSAPQKV